ncbi:TadE/TadG family type IV pilus assembly protein [Microbacterium ureisolvens]|uniref:Pilus assembly protein n=1 Tax=Microbacterium ureisolvens TaxID=2781186 RepID=A0ABS7HSD5_9MICO|nr:TadE/TadG family type IV pilus assembly protein [Microbacterium ureisolvens]MBW9108219.1 pilus assembly protein [Microbacterium ureisolvens]
MRVVLARAAAGVRAGLAANLRDEAGASPVEFVLVGALLTVLTLGVLQFGLAVYVRNVVHDAAVEGAYHAALADTTLAEGAQRTRDIVGRTIGAEYITDVTVHETGALGQPTVEVRVQATLPLVGLLGAPRGLEVMAHAPVESFD